MAEKKKPRFLPFPRVDGKVPRGIPRIVIEHTDGIEGRLVLDGQGRPDQVVCGIFEGAAARGEHLEEDDRVEGNKFALIVSVGDDHVYWYPAKKPDVIHLLFAVEEGEPIIENRTDIPVKTYFKRPEPWPWWRVHWKEIAVGAGAVGTGLAITKMLDWW